MGDFSFYDAAGEPIPAPYGGFSTSSAFKAFKYLPATPVDVENTEAISFVAPLGARRLELKVYSWKAERLTAFAVPHLDRSSEAANGIALSRSTPVTFEFSVEGGAGYSINIDIRGTRVSDVDSAVGDFSFYDAAGESIKTPYGGFSASSTFKAFKYLPATPVDVENTEAISFVAPLGARRLELKVYSWKAERLMAFAAPRVERHSEATSGIEFSRTKPLTFEFPVEGGAGYSINIDIRGTQVPDEDSAVGKFSFFDASGLVLPAPYNGFSKSSAFEAFKYLPCMPMDTENPAGVTFVAPPGADRLELSVYAWKTDRLIVVGAPQLSPNADAAASSAETPRAQVLMIVLNDVETDGRVLRCAECLRDANFEVTIFGVTRNRAAEKSVLKRISGFRTRLFPDPIYFFAKDSGFGGAPGLSWLGRVNAVAAEMWRHARSVNPTILHTHDFNTLSIGYQFASLLRRRHSLYWIHDVHEYVAGLDFSNADVVRAGLDHEEKYLPLADKVITVSTSLASALQKKYFLRGEPTVIVNTNDKGRAERDGQPTIRTVLQLPPSTPLAVYIGGVSQARGVHTLVKALPHLPDLHVALVTNNTGAYVDSLIAEADQTGCSDRLHFLNYVAPDRLNHFLSDATVGVHPMVRYGNAEVALPNKLFHYCAAGLPVVVSDCRTMAEFVRGWKVGEVFVAEDAEDLCRALTQVLSNPLEYTKNADSVFERFSWDEQKRALVQLYDHAEAELAERDADAKRNRLLAVQAEGAIADQDATDVEIEPNDSAKENVT